MFYEVLDLGQNCVDSPQTFCSLCLEKKGFIVSLQTKVACYCVCSFFVLFVSGDYFVGAVGEAPTCAAWSSASPFASLFQPIVDLSPIKRSASSLTPQSHREVELRDYDLERDGQLPAGPGQIQEEERVHHHHHHHRCHRRRDKDREKKHRSLEKAASGQPGSTTGETDGTLSDSIQSWSSSAEM